MVTPDPIAHLDDFEPTCSLVDKTKDPNIKPLHQCPNPARYIARIHLHERNGMFGPWRPVEGGKLVALCQGCLEFWQAQAYPIRCADCKHAFNHFLDYLWDIEEFNQPRKARP